MSHRRKFVGVHKYRGIAAGITFLVAFALRRKSPVSSGQNSDSARQPAIINFVQ